MKCSDTFSVSASTLQLIRSDVSVLPHVLLSRWWKREGEDINHKLPSLSSNPRTQLHHIARHSKGRDILFHRIAHLQQQLSKGHTPKEWLLHFNLASCLHMLSSDLQTTTLALTHAREAIHLYPGWEQEATELQVQRSDVEWLVEVLVRQREVEEAKMEKRNHLSRADLVLALPQPTQVERRCACDLSLRQFITEFALTHTPVVITGLVGHMTFTPWTLNYIRKRVSDKVAPLRKMVRGSVEWARLESASSCTVDEFVDSLNTNQDKRYLFDWGLPLSCPELASELNIPKYFANDFLQRTPEGSMYRDSWPSLFIAPAGVVSELHVDAFGSNFWMALFEGRKRWVFFPPEDTPLLYPVYTNSTDAVFEADLSSPNHAHHPLLSLTHPRECVLEQGEVLYVPAGCPHRVENLEKSLAISANFVDCSNFDLVKKELQVNALVDECAKQLLGVIQDESFDTRMRGLSDSCHSLNGIKTFRNENEMSGSPHDHKGVESSGLEMATCVSWTDFKQQTMTSVVCSERGLNEMSNDSL